jgi:ribosomal protein L18
MVVRRTKHYSHAQIEDDGMGGTRGMYRKEQKLIQGFGGETRQEETSWKTYVQMGG